MRHCDVCAPLTLINWESSAMLIFATLLSLILKVRAGLSAVASSLRVKSNVLESPNGSNFGLKRFFLPKFRKGLVGNFRQVVKVAPRQRSLFSTRDRCDEKS